MAPQAPCPEHILLHLACVETKAAKRQSTDTRVRIKSLHNRRAILLILQINKPGGGKGSEAEKSPDVGQLLASPVVKETVVSTVQCAAVFKNDVEARAVVSASKVLNPLKTQLAKGFVAAPNTLDTERWVKGR